MKTPCGRESYLERGLAYVESLSEWQGQFFHELTCGRFEEAAKIADAGNAETLLSIMFELSFPEPDLRIYVYSIARLINKETADDHASASQNTGFCYGVSRWLLQYRCGSSASRHRHKPA